MSELVNIGVLSSASRRALEVYSQLHGYEEWLGDRAWIESHWLAWLLALLKAENDDPQLFPRGKWATIQLLEGLLAKSAVMAVGMRVKEDKTP